MKTQFTLAIVSTIVFQTAAAVALNVPGMADPWLAGMPDGTLATTGHASAPAQSPVLAASTVGGTIYTFQAIGSVAQGPTEPLIWTPDGNTSHGIVTSNEGGNNNIAGLTAPVDALVGIFLGPGLPTLGTTPPALNFSSPESRDYLLLSPLMQQPFFIGDGLTSLGQLQQVVAPAGATRLFLGVMDVFQWENNIGSYTVQVVPEPSSGALGLGAFALLLFRRRQH